MSSRYITAIDIGSSKVAAIVGEKTSTGIKIIGYSEVPSEGVVRGEVIKSQKVANAVSEALHNVKEQIQSVPDTENYRIRKVYVNISGQNIRCCPGSVHRDRPDPYSTIDADEINSMLGQMYGMETGPSEEVLYVAPQYYNVDEHMGETDPEDMDGKSIDGEYKVFIGKSSAVAHCKSALDRLNLDISKLILTPIASGAALLTDDEKELGSVLVDIGAGTTDVIIYQANIIRYAAVIPFGGNSITEDISQTCGISMKNAEQLKIQRGSCISEFAKENRIIIKESGMTVKDVPSKLLSSAIEARVCEILATVRHIIEISGFRNKLRSRAVLTGGSARISLIQLLAKNILNMDVRLGMPDSSIITGNSVEQAFRPQASAAIGLIKEGFRYEAANQETEESVPENESAWNSEKEEPRLFSKEEIDGITQTQEERRTSAQTQPQTPNHRNRRPGIKDIIQTLFPNAPGDDEA